MIHDLIARVQAFCLEPNQVMACHLAPDHGPADSNPDLFWEGVCEIQEFRRAWAADLDEDSNPDDVLDIFGETCYEERHAFLGLIHSDGVLLVAVPLEVRA